MKCSLRISNFLEEISSLSYSIVFLCFFALITEEGFLISPCYSLELCIQMDRPFFLLCPSLIFSAIFKASSDNHFPFLHSFSWGWSWSLTLVQYHKPLPIVFQALCLSDLIPLIYFSLSLYNCKGFDLGHIRMVVVFPTFFNLSLNLAIRSSWSEAQSALSLVFADCIELLHLWLQRI